MLPIGPDRDVLMKDLMGFKSVFSDAVSRGDLIVIEELKKLHEQLETLGVKDLGKKYRKVLEKLKSLGVNKDTLVLVEKMINSAIAEQRRYEEKHKKLLAEYDTMQQKVTDEQIADIAKEVIRQAENIQRNGFNKR